MTNENLVIRSWHDYELLDSGDNRKLERFGKFFLIRPETQALWQPSRAAGEWARADAEFRFADGKGAWHATGVATFPKNGNTSNTKRIPATWEMQWNDAHFILRPTAFKHVGVFPEQAANWEWIAERVTKASRILNLFGYTGIASIVAAEAGAHVTHVDASKQSNEWAKENATLSEVPAEISPAAGGIRYICDDALKFVEREARRGAEYDGVILDPPAFGRGAKGEVWHIEEQLSHLLAALAKILSAKPGAFFLLNGYAAGYSPQSFRQAVASFFPVAEKLPSAEFGELQIQESGGRLIPSGIYVRFAG